MYGNRQNSIHNKVKMHSKLNYWNTEVHTRKQTRLWAKQRRWSWRNDACIYIHQINKQPNGPGQYTWWCNKTSTKSKHVHEKNEQVKIASVCVCVHIIYNVCDSHGCLWFEHLRTQWNKKRKQDSIFHARSFVIKTFLEYKISHSPSMWLNKFNLTVTCMCVCVCGCGEKQNGREREKKNRSRILYIDQMNKELKPFSQHTFSFSFAFHWKFR